MTVTRIEELSRSRCKIYLEDSFAFVLYKGELRLFGVREQEELSEESYREIMQEVLPKRATLRCMNLLKSMDRTEFQLRQKLAMGDYPAEIIDQALAYVKGFGYVNDESYAERYIELRRERDSRMQITHALMQKGISKDVIQAIFEEQEPADEEEMIRRWMEKKHFDPETASAKEKQKMYMFLMRKGFSASEISRAFHSEK